MLARHHPMHFLVPRRATMSSIDLDLDSQMSALESEWRQAYEAGNAAREQLQALSAMPKPNEFTLAKAYDRLERAEGLKARIMGKIEKLEDTNTRVP
jgi:hypothetical protein